VEKFKWKSPIAYSDIFNYPIISSAFMMYVKLSFIPQLHIRVRFQIFFEPLLNASAFCISEQAAFIYCISQKGIKFNLIRF
jgi:hypothetical protein